MSEQPGRPNGQPDHQPDPAAGQQPPPYGSAAPDFSKQTAGPQGTHPAPGGYGQPAPGGYQQPSPGYGQQAPDQPSSTHPGQQGYSAPGPQGYGAPGQGGYGQPAAEMSPADQRLWACLAHVSSIVSAIVGLTFLGPLVVYLVLKDRGVFIRRQSAEALNFQILVNIVYVVLLFLTFVTLGIGGLLFVPAVIVAVVFVVIAAVKANQGVDYRYPVNWRLVS